MASSATAFEVVLPHQTLPEQPFVYNHHFTTTRLLHHGKMSNKRQVEAKLEKTSQKGLVWYVAKTWLLCKCDFVCSGEGYSIALSQVLILCFQAAKYINNYNNISPNRLMCIKCWGIYSLQSAGLPTIVSPRGKNANSSNFPAARLARMLVALWSQTDAVCWLLGGFPENTTSVCKSLLKQNLALNLLTWMMDRWRRYDAVSDVVESGVQWRSNFQIGSRALKIC